MDAEHFEVAESNLPQPLRWGWREVLVTVVVAVAWIVLVGIARHWLGSYAAVVIGYLLAISGYSIVVACAAHWCKSLRERVYFAILAVCMIGGSVLVVAYYVQTGELAEAAHDRLVRHCVAALDAELPRDARFNNVRVQFEHVKSIDFITIRGLVSTKSALDDLRDIVRKQRPDGRMCVSCAVDCSDRAGANGAGQGRAGGRGE